MVITSMLVPALALAAGNSHPVSFQPIFLRDAGSKAEAAALSAELDTVMGVAASCHAQSLDAALRCGCGATDHVKKLRAVYGHVAARHPDWNRPSTVVSYQNPMNGHWISLSLPAVRSMLEQCGRR